MMRMKVYLLCALCFIVISLSGCGDLNATYDDDAAIAKSEDTNSQASMGVVKVGNNLSVTSMTLTGSTTLWRYDADRDIDVTFSYLLSVTSGGKAKLVLITPDDEVIILAENADHTASSEVQSQTVSIKKGNNRIKVVGYDAAKFAFQFSVDVGQLIW